MYQAKTGPLDLQGYVARREIPVKGAALVILVNQGFLEVGEKWVVLGFLDVTVTLAPWAPLEAPALQGPRENAGYEGSRE